MTQKTDDTANKYFTGTNKLKEKASRNQVITAPLPDPIAKNIEAIISLHTQEVRDIPAHQRILEAIATFFGRPIFLYSLLLILAIWIFSSFLDGFLPFNLPLFSWSDQGLDAAALVISTGVLVRQTRQENFAEQRAQLMLQLNLLSEQKIAKIIALLEELRTDLPNVINRHDSEAQLMQQAADPIAVLEALQKNLTEELSSTEENNMS
ncbi:MAG: DUF1003 domain-containing protein [Nostoc sp. NOS(2021)]|uniref:DUF1003 domain-containing protein n=1 Tax=Nostoc sp. NOS(2021) TaxID=2815407 RepID=UPI0025EC49FC|nr:DUF1003 domain-containing protein [Nostoc sp. NOS(2021)]MBN3899664.1 DUF1003 domain-containing protein [Nostoc sp. NOS(2021)]